MSLQKVVQRKDNRLDEGPWKREESPSWPMVSMRDRGFGFSPDLCLEDCAEKRGGGGLGEGGGGRGGGGGGGKVVGAGKR